MTKLKLAKEKNVVKNILKALDKHYPGFYFKVHGGPYQMAGIPDILGLYKGHFIGIEVKQPGKENTLSTKQKQVISKINAAGGIAFMATTPDMVIDRLGREFNGTVSLSKNRTKKLPHS